MKYRKTYQALEFKDLDTYEMIDGQKTLIKFRGQGQSIYARGIFVTSDQAVIRALDNSTSYGISFKVIKSEVIPGSEVKAAPVAEAPEVAHTPDLADTPDLTDDKDLTDDLADVFDYTDVPGITTVQAAKEYLVANHGGQVSKLQNWKAVAEFAKANKVRFTDM